jgi:hypothetical protein
MLRKIHLDFHTRPSAPGIGSAFDPEEFADIDQKKLRPIGNRPPFQVRFTGRRMRRSASTPTLWFSWFGKTKSQPAR